MVKPNNRVEIVASLLGEHNKAEFDRELVSKKKLTGEIEVAKEQREGVTTTQVAENVTCSSQTVRRALYELEDTGAVKVNRGEYENVIEINCSVEKLIDTARKLDQ